MKKVFVISACVIVVLVCAVIVVVYSMSSPTPQLQGAPHIERTEILDRVVDGDTIVLQGEEKVRLCGINTPEIPPHEEPGGREAKEFVEDLCPLGTEIGLDVDDLEPEDHYGRTLAVVYVEVDGVWVNLNAKLLREGYAEVMFIPPSEFNPYEWAN